MEKIKTALLKDGAEFIDVVNLMELTAATNVHYSQKLDIWLKHGGTVLLRDELIEPLKSTGIFKWIGGPCPQFNALAFIDSAWLGAKK